MKTQEKLPHPSSGEYTLVIIIMLMSCYNNNIMILLANELMLMVVTVHATIVFRVNAHGCLNITLNVGLHGCIPWIKIPYDIVCIEAAIVAP